MRDGVDIIAKAPLRAIGAAEAVPDPATQQNALLLAAAAA